MSESDIKAALTDLEALWLTLWGEARSEPVEGQIAVACVIRNRVQTPKRFGASYAKVCLRPMQFSCWNEGTDANHVRLMALAAKVAARDTEATTSYVTPRIRQLAFLAAGIIGQQIEDRVKGADHYLTTDLLLTKPPRWARGSSPVCHVGRHSFFRLG